jgi:hypothetical protein
MGKDKSKILNLLPEEIDKITSIDQIKQLSNISHVEKLYIALERFGKRMGDVSDERKNFTSNITIRTQELKDYINELSIENTKLEKDFYQRFGMPIVIASGALTKDTPDIIAYVAEKSELLNLQATKEIRNIQLGKNETDETKSQDAKSVAVSKGETLVMYLFRNNQTVILEKLLEKHSGEELGINLTTPDGSTILHDFLNAYKEETIEVKSTSIPHTKSQRSVFSTQSRRDLLNEMPIRKLTPKTEKSVKLLECLINAGADVNIINKYNETPLDLAYKKGGEGRKAYELIEKAKGVTTYPLRKIMHVFDGKIQHNKEIAKYTGNDTDISADWINKGFRSFISKLPQKDDKIYNIQTAINQLIEHPKPEDLIIRTEDNNIEISPHVIPQEKGQMSILPAGCKGHAFYFTVQKKDSDKYELTMCERGLLTSLSMKAKMRTIEVNENELKEIIKKLPEIDSMPMLKAAKELFGPLTFASGKMFGKQFKYKEGLNSKHFKDGVCSFANLKTAVKDIMIQEYGIKEGNKLYKEFTLHLRKEELKNAQQMDFEQYEKIGIKIDKQKIVSDLKLAVNGKEFPQDKDQKYIYSFTKAIKENDVELVKDLLKRGYAKAKDKDGNTLLHIAAAAGNKDIVSLLVDKGVDINAKNKKGYTALEVALDENPGEKGLSTAKEIVRNGFNPKKAIRVTSDERKELDEEKLNRKDLVEKLTNLVTEGGAITSDRLKDKLSYDKPIGKLTKVVEDLSKKYEKATRKLVDEVTKEQIKRASKGKDAIPQDEIRGKFNKLEHEILKDVSKILSKKVKQHFKEDPYHGYSRNKPQKDDKPRQKR